MKLAFRSIVQDIEAAYKYEMIIFFFFYSPFARCYCGALDNSKYHILLLLLYFHADTYCFEGTQTMPAQTFTALLHRAFSIIASHCNTSTEHSSSIVKF